MYSGTHLSAYFPRSPAGAARRRARRAVAVLRQREDPDLLLMGFVDAAVLRLVTEVEARYPEIASLDDETKVD
jgi:hypothetical protein